jgi:protein phosphatase
LVFYLSYNNLFYISKVLQITWCINSLSNLVKSATKTTNEEFVELIEQISHRLAKEEGVIGDLKITGRLVKIPASGKIVIIGDLHGDLNSLLFIIRQTKFLTKAKTNKKLKLIFLGDYGDRGFKSPEIYYIVLKLKQIFPKQVILMRGNHEGPPDLIASPHDLIIHLKHRFGKNGSLVYLKIKNLFRILYNGVIIEKRYVLFHGGMPSQAKKISDIAFATQKHPQEPHLEEILWNDPWNFTGSITSPRGAGKLFGEDITYKVLKMLDVKCLIRGHQSCENGYKFDHNNKILTIFSRKGEPYSNKHGAYLHLDFSRNVKPLIAIKSSIQIF